MTAAEGAAPHELDAWYFQRWARTQRVGDPTRKLLLQLLAESADRTTGTCRPKQTTLAEWAEVSDRTVREHLKRLEAAGLIARRTRHRLDGKRAADEFLLLAPGVGEWPDGMPATGSGSPPEDSSGGSAAPPTTGSGLPGKDVPLGERTTGRGENARASEPKPDPRSKLPDDFPQHLRPHAIAVYRILRAVAEQHPTAGPVWPLSVGKAIASHPRHPLVAVAHELDGWAVDPPRPIRDVVGTYRTFLGKRRELAATEALADDGTPTNAPRGAPAGVHPIRGGRYDEATRARDAAALARLSERMGVGR